MRRSPQYLEFRGYVFGRGQEWNAICLDLDIAAQGRSFHEAKCTLEEMVDDYLHTVRRLPVSEQKRLLRRRAPFSVRVWHHLTYALASLFNERKGSDRLSFVLHRDNDSGACAA